MMMVTQFLGSLSFERLTMSSGVRLFLNTMEPIIAIPLASNTFQAAE
jgi:hypothetical protein